MAGQVQEAVVRAALLADGDVDPGERELRGEGLARGAEPVAAGVHDRGAGEPAEVVTTWERVRLGQQVRIADVVQLEHPHRVLLGRIAGRAPRPGRGSVAGSSRVERGIAEQQCGRDLRAAVASAEGRARREVPARARAADRDRARGYAERVGVLERPVEGREQLQRGHRVAHPGPGCGDLRLDLRARRHVRPALLVRQLEQEVGGRERVARPRRPGSPARRAAGPSDRPPACRGCRRGSHRRGPRPARAPGRRRRRVHADGERMSCGLERDVAHGLIDGHVRLAASSGTSAPSRVAMSLRATDGERHRGERGVAGDRGRDDVVPSDVQAVDAPDLAARRADRGAVVDRTHPRRALVVQGGARREHDRRVADELAERARGPQHRGLRLGERRVVPLRQHVVDGRLRHPPLVRLVVRELDPVVGLHVLRAEPAEPDDRAGLGRLVADQRDRATRRAASPGRGRGARRCTAPRRRRPRGRSRPRGRRPGRARRRRAAGPRTRSAAGR